jgi:spore photoproduct lyase
VPWVGGGHRVCCLDAPNEPKGRIAVLRLSPQRIIVTEDAWQRSDCRPVIDRLIGAMAVNGQPEIVGDERLSRLPEEYGWVDFGRWGHIPWTQRRDPDIVFTTAKFHDEQERQARLASYPGLKHRDLGGYHHWWFRPDGEPWFHDENNGVVCQSAWQIHSASGCPFRCDYCWFGDVCRLFVNLDEWCSHLDEWIDQAGNQRLFKWDNQTDVLCFEPEWGHARMLVEYFAGKPDKYLQIYAGKSDNVNSLLELDHRGKTIIQWSIGPRVQCERMEQRTASMDERIEAVRACAEAGYLARYRFSPMIPVVNWRDAYTELIEAIFAKTRPDIVTLCAFGWMDYEVARTCLRWDLIDPQVAEAMRATSPFINERGLKAGGGHPMPFDVRLAMYRHCIDQIRRVSPDTHVALCLEMEEMWAVFGEELKGRPGAYVCNCGPHCTPGGAMYDRVVGSPQR